MHSGTGIDFPSCEVDVGVEHVFSCFAVLDDLFYDLLIVFFAWPGCLSGGSIAVSSSAACSNPLTESAASIS